MDTSERLAQLDRKVLAAAGRVSGFYTWPTTTIVMTFWTYLVTLVIAVVAPRYLALGAMRDVIVALPLLTLLLHLCMLYWIYRASDEYLRQRMLRGAALAGVVVMFSSTGYFCLEQLGYPRLPMLAVNLYAWSVYVLLIVWVRYRAR